MTNYQRQRLEFLWRIAQANSQTRIECTHCAESDIRVLQAGHKRDDGSAHFRELVGFLHGGGSRLMSRRKGFTDFLRALIALGWPRQELRRMQIECANCNVRKTSTFKRVWKFEIRRQINALENQEMIDRWGGKKERSAAQAR